VIIIYSLDAPKSIRETEKTLKTLLSGQKTQKNSKKPKKPKKNQKNPKNPLGWFFFFYKKTRVFSNPATEQCSGSTCFLPPGSGQRYGSGSGSFYHHAKIIRKTLNPTIL
jgi:hypothetical protein